MIGLCNGDPYKDINWTKCDIVQTNWKTGETIFEQKDVEFPDFWSMNARTIVATKYFREDALGVRENSLKQLLERVVGVYAREGVIHGYFDADYADDFADDLKWFLTHQYFSFNSPVWFNVGTSSPQQVSACFILGVEDSIEGISQWIADEATIFKGGSGAGVNIGTLRAEGEPLSNHGQSSGPLSFMRSADASAGAIKSGGKNRRSAKMLTMDVDHPDIEEFVDAKRREEGKIRALRDAGYDMEIGGRDIVSVQYQNANNSVRLSDEFMYAVREGLPWELTARTDGSVMKTVNAAELFDKIAQAAWECADPGVQFSTTISEWHTAKTDGPITASNPCGEYLSVDHSSCNLASLNLVKFLKEDLSFDFDMFSVAIDLIVTAMDISICFGDFPTERIADTTHRLRQLGLGYANLGAMLMRLGLPYDSDAGRLVAAAVTSFMSASAWSTSALLADQLGPYSGFEDNKYDHLEVMGGHCEKAVTLSGVSARTKGVPESFVLMAEIASDTWEGLVAGGGLRNSQISLLAPTGTIGFMMDCDTTGIEPDFALVKYKKVVDGSSMKIVNESIPPALKVLGYSDNEIIEILAYVKANDVIIGAPYISEDHCKVFQCAVGENAISPEGHIDMMAAVQPFLSGAISKTVNLPENATVDDVKKVFVRSWEKGVKSTTVYRDGCKAFQPLSGKKSSTQAQEASHADKASHTCSCDRGEARRRLPGRRVGVTTSFSVGGADGYMTTGMHPDGELGEVFLKLGKQGSTLGGVMDGFSILLSVALQYGVPLDVLVQKFTGMSFEPSGFTSDPDLPMAKSLLDYVFRRLALDHMDSEARRDLNVLSKSERTSDLSEDYAMVKEHDAPLCLTCGSQTQRAGSCHVCPACGTTTGCS